MPKNEESTNPTDVFTVAEIAKKAKVSENYVRAAINRSELAETRLGRCIRVSQASYDDWIRKSTGSVRT